MKEFKNGRDVFDGADIAAALGFPNPSSKCSRCGHKRFEHRREIIQGGGGPNHREEAHECDHWDRRRKTGHCPCEHFVEPVATS